MSPGAPDKKECEAIRPYLDSYTNNELLVETTHRILAHLQTCEECAAALSARSKVKSRLKEAISNQPVPPGLEGKIRASIRSRRRHETWSRWSLSLAACLVIALGVTGTLRILTARRAREAARVARFNDLMSIGLADHVHCAIEIGSGWQHNSDEEMTRLLGPEYAGLLDVVRKNVPAGYQIVVAHRCITKGRKYVHVIMRKGDDIVSLAVTRKKAESFSAEGMGSPVQAGGVRLYQSRIGNIGIVGFETSEYLAFVVSGLPQESDMLIASNLAPEVSGFLSSRPA